ncbi:MAG: hypothetical protein EHM61_07190 [Acidobacteria bacterium]|nr:MAG: hypothetical protein EHM61_07190 [Acidobacteriota bacterium]
MRKCFLVFICFWLIPAGLRADVFYFPHLADGQGTYTLFSITNHSERVATGDLSLFTLEGSPLTLPFVGGPQSVLPLSLAPHSTQLFITSGTSNPVVSGWAKVQLSEENVTGAAMFRYGDGREATVLPSKMGNQMSFYVERSAELETGIAFCRTGAMPLDLSLYNSSGKLIETRSFQFSGKKIAQFLGELFTALPAHFSGSLIIESGVPFTAVGLRFGPSILSVVPGFDFVSHQTYFSPNSGVEAAILKAVEEAKSQIDVAVYSFTSEALGTALIAAKNRGVSVRVVLDLSQGSAPGQQTERLIAAGITVTKVKGVNHRFTIFDGHRVLTGSYDWMPSAALNYEDALFLTTPEVVTEYIKQFSRLAQ